jgi:hypothetical protein
VALVPLALGFFIWLGLPLHTAGQQSSTPLQFDPLSPDEIGATLQISAEDQNVQGYLGGARYQHILTQRFDDGLKREPGDSARLAESVFYIYERDGTAVDLTLLVVADLRASRVVSATPSSGSRPPLARDELRRAQEIALADERVQVLLAQQHVTPEQVAIYVYGLQPEEASGPCARNRCMAFILAPVGQPGGTFVSVNLTTQRVELTG